MLRLIDTDDEKLKLVECVVDREVVSDIESDLLFVALLDTDGDKLRLMVNEDDSVEVEESEEELELLALLDNDVLCVDESVTLTELVNTGVPENVALLLVLTVTDVDTERLLLQVSDDDSEVDRETVDVNEELWLVLRVSVGERVGVAEGLVVTL